MKEITSGFAAVVIFTRLQEMGFNIWVSFAAAILFGYATAYAAKEILKEYRGRERKRKWE